MKSAQCNGVVRVGHYASSNKIFLFHYVKKQPLKALPENNSSEFSGILVISVHKRHKYRTGRSAKSSPIKVNHQFNKRTVPPQARVTGKESSCLVKATPVPSTATDLKTPYRAVLMASLSAPPADNESLKAASLSSCQFLLVHGETKRTVLPKYTGHLQESRLPCKTLNAPISTATTARWQGIVPFVSLRRLLYGVLFAMLLQLDVCNAAVAMPHPPPHPSVLWKNHPRPDAGTAGAPAAPHQRGLKEVNSVLNNYQNATWEVTSVPAVSDGYGAIECSYTGQHVVAADYYNALYTSNDFGATWNKSLSAPGYYVDIACSSDGQYWAAVSHFFGIYTSSDYGATWSLTSAPPIGWYAIASSGCGQFLAAATYYDTIYNSYDYGDTWNATSAVAANWNSIDSSDSGQYLAAVSQSVGLYTSSDYGLTWHLSPSVGNEYTYWNSAVISENGQYLAALGYGTTYTSSDYGASWNVSSPQNTWWNYLASSGGGHYMAGDHYGVYASDDYGATWYPSSAQYFSIYSAALSGDGQFAYSSDISAIYRLTRNAAPLVVAPSAVPSVPLDNYGPTTPPSNSSLQNVTAPANS